MGSDADSQQHTGPDEKNDQRNNKGHGDRDLGDQRQGRRGRLGRSATTTRLPNVYEKEQQSDRKDRGIPDAK